MVLRTAFIIRSRRWGRSSALRASASGRLRQRLWSASARTKSPSDSAVTKRKTPLLGGVFTLLIQAVEYEQDKSGRKYPAQVDEYFFHHDTPHATIVNFLFSL